MHQFVVVSCSIKRCVIHEHVRVIVSGVVEVVADARRQQYADVLFRQLLPQLAQVHEPVHHLAHAETMPEVVKRIVAIVFLDAQLKQQGKRFHVCHPMQRIRLCADITLRHNQRNSDIYIF
jgi:hypothetical protein